MYRKFQKISLSTGSFISQYLSHVSGLRSQVSGLGPENLHRNKLKNQCRIHLLKSVYVKSIWHVASPYHISKLSDLVSELLRVIQEKHKSASELFVVKISFYYKERKLNTTVN